MAEVVQPELNEAGKPKGASSKGVDTVLVEALRQLANPARAGWFRALIVGAMLIALEVIVFRGYFTGAQIPPFDFLGSYNTDAYVWWTDGSFFDPIDWVSSSWAGYPAAMVLQNSAWYLPVGLASAFGPYTLHSAAILAALHVAFGSIGTYLLARSFRAPFVSACLAAAAGFFAVGYFSNAEHVDITRGYALIPWALLVLSARWPWSKFWAVPVATLILWQTITGIYPGMLVSLAYIAVPWVVVSQMDHRPRVRAYLIPAAIAFVASVLLSAPRLLPYALLQGGTASGLPETSIWTPSMIGTTLFGYDVNLANDISMRSFFVPATVIVLALFARWRDPITRAGLAIWIPAVLLGMPFFPWFTREQELPGLGLSRFTMSDFKPFIVLGLVLLACSGLSRLLSLAGTSRLTQRIGGGFAAAVAFAAVMEGVGIRGPFTTADWFPEFCILAGVIGLLALYLLLRRCRGVAQALSGTLVILTVASGVAWTIQSARPWSSDRAEVEAVTYGATVDQLLARRTVPSGDTVQRAARTPLGDDRSLGHLLSVAWNGSYYTGKDAVGGYINLKGSATESLLQRGLLSTVTGQGLADFLAAPGRVLSSTDRSPSAKSLEACASGIDCGKLRVKPISYRPGALVYQVTAESASNGFLNEAYFSGWQAKACTKESCVQVAVTQSELGVIKVALPEGSYMLSLTYRTAGRSAGWILFGAGALTALGSAAFTILGTVRRRHKRTAIKQEVR